ncbi:MAG: hypothetical protein ACJA0V_004736 [Planctomycetota bacterium]|jgi:hypothetical protein
MWIARAVQNSKVRLMALPWARWDVRGLTINVDGVHTVHMKEQATQCANGLLSLLALATFASAQSPCGVVAQPGFGGPGGPTGTIYVSATMDPDGAGPLPANLVVGGNFGPANIALWDVTAHTWSSLGAGFANSIRVLTSMPNGDVVAGVTSFPGGTAVTDVQRFDGTQWSSLVTSIGGSAYALHALPNGDLLVGGDFTSINGVTAAGLARWNGTAWAEFAGGVAGPFPSVNKFGVMANGDLIVGGRFTSAGGVTANNIATFDGTAFSPLGSGLENNGVIVSAPNVTDLITMANGDLFACGMFQEAGGVPVNSVAMWDGNNWSAMGAGLGGPSIYYGVVASATQLPNGDIVVGGGYPWPGVAFEGRVDRWDGNSWQQQGTTIGQFIYTVEMTSESLAVGGLGNGGLWEITSTCPAATVSLGAACPSSGGANELTASTLPWTGSTFEMNATGLPSLSLLAIDGGLAPLGPLSLTSIGLQAAPPGCLLHITPTYFELALTTTGEHSFSWEIPNNPLFAGIDVYWQIVAFEVDPALQLLETTSTNALKLTIGSM